MLLVWIAGLQASYALGNEVGEKKPKKVNVQDWSDVDKELTTGSVIRSNEMLRYCMNISDAATEVRSTVLKEELEAIEKQVDEKLTKLNAKIEKLKIWTAKREMFLKSGNDSLVKVFQSMRPDAAASQLSEIGPVQAAAIIFKLEPKFSSAIMAEMKPSIAAKIAIVITSAIDIEQKK